MVAGVIAYSRVKRNDPARADEAAQAAGLSEWAMSQERRPDPIAPTTPSTDAISTWGLHHRHTRLDHEALELVLLPRVDADTKDTDDLRRTTITSS
jgi:hypothetical protein